MFTDTNGRYDTHEMGNDTENVNLFERVQTIINLIRPALQSDGGDIELIDVSEDGVVRIRFHGACVGCPSSNLTLQTGIERNIKNRIPEIREVIPVK